MDVGTGVDDDSLPAAKDALVLMVVCMNGSRNRSAVRPQYYHIPTSVLG